MKYDIDREFSHIHIPKCGGSWVHAFFRHAYPGKLIHSSHGSLSNLMPNHWMAWRSESGPMKSGHPLWDVDYSKESHNEFKIVIHFPPSDTPGRFASSIKFSVSRNPFDWLVSYYSSNFGDVNDTHGIRSFQEFVEKFCDPDFRWWHYSLHKFMFYQLLDCDGRIGVHWILRMENLKKAIDMMLLNHGANPEHLRERWNTFGIDHSNNPKANVSKQRKHVDHRFYYDDRLREIATKRFAPELQVMRYDFDGPTDQPTLLRTPLEDNGDPDLHFSRAMYGIINLGCEEVKVIKEGEMVRVSPARTDGIRDGNKQKHLKEY